MSSAPKLRPLLVASLFAIGAALSACEDKEKKATKFARNRPRIPR